MFTTRSLIVNADDFGQTAGINEGIMRCHKAGIVTSASLMVCWPHASTAVEYARANPTLSLGLHIDLGEWVCRDGEWRPLYLVSSGDPAAIRKEISHQFEMFHRLTGDRPTHIDSHQHIHRREPVRSIVTEMSQRLGVPLRHGTADIGYLGAFYGQTPEGRAVDGAIDVQRLIGLLRTLPVGTTELVCHPGVRDDAPGMYVAERTREASVLCDPRVRAAIQAEQIHLVSFSAYSALAASAN